MVTDRGRIKSLDGLRALSIILVIVSHLVGIRGFFIPVPAGRVFELGELGVRVFFVISGFLITSILLKELTQSHKIDLPRFYFRRTLRIFPPYYLFLLALAIAGAIGFITLNPGDLAHALTYTSNYHQQRSWLVGHTWSLAVEEQFYILWPAALLLLGKRKGLLLAFAFVLLAPLIRIGIWEIFPSMSEGIGQRFETIADSIAAGCLLAGMRVRLHGWATYRKWMDSKAVVVVAALVVLAGNAMHNHPLPHFFVGYTIMNLGIAFCIDWCVTNHSGSIGRALNYKPVVTIGVMSYSIYLWQQIFLDRYSQSALCRFPLNVLLVAVASTLSYLLCEKPCFAARKWLERRIFKQRDKTRIQADDQPPARQTVAGIQFESMATASPEEGR